MIFERSCHGIQVHVTKFNGLVPRQDPGKYVPSVTASKRGTLSLRAPPSPSRILPEHYHDEAMTTPLLVSLFPPFI
jgi:hypothetical protein